MLPLSLLGQLRAQPKIIDATPIQLVVSAVPRAPAAIVFGIDSGGFVARRLVYTAGHGPATGQAVLGDLLAAGLVLGEAVAVSLLGTAAGLVLGAIYPIWRVRRAWSVTTLAQT